MAALVVVFHHGLLTVPQLSAAYFDQPVTHPLAIALVRTPLHLLWDGPAAVSIFFALSGFVLTMAVTGRRIRRLSFDAQRLVRLYLPAWAATAFALALALAVPRHSLVGVSAWVDAHDVPLVSSTVRCITLWRPSPLNSPLWSLKWEVAFSLLLPLYLWAAAKVGRAWPAVPVVAALLSMAGARAGVDSLTYLPQFMTGVVCAMHLEEFKRWGARFAQPRLVLVALALIAASWVPAPGGLQTLLRAGLPSLATPLLLAACLIPGTTTRFLEHRLSQWLGRISFSLYLTHEPIVVTLAALGLPAPLVLPAALPLSLVVAAAFHRLVERPAHRLAKRIPVTRELPPPGGATPLPS